MRIEHIAIWAKDLEKLKDFYTKYFGGVANEKYTNSIKNFNSYFISFDNASARIELMQKSDINENEYIRGLTYGFAHIAISVGSKEKVNTLTEKLRNDGFIIIGEPRLTGDGYYESIVEDSEGNWIEITI